MKTDNNIISDQQPDSKLNQQSIPGKPILTPDESAIYSEDIEERKAETNLSRRPQFRINENSIRRFN